MGKTIKSLRRNPDAPLWRDVLKSIKAKPKLAFYFAKPVDHVALNIPLYPTIVKTPMDLQTIERKLAANEYAELDDFAKDVRLVFSNAMLFNKNEQHQVHIAARKLSTFFELKYEELKRGHQREKRDALAEVHAMEEAEKRKAIQEKQPEKREAMTFLQIWLRATSN